MNTRLKLSVILLLFGAVLALLSGGMVWNAFQIRSRAFRIDRTLEDLRAISRVRSSVNRLVKDGTAFFLLHDGRMSNRVAVDRKEARAAFSAWEQLESKEHPGGTPDDLEGSQLREASLLFDRLLDRFDEALGEGNPGGMNSVFVEKVIPLAAKLHRKMDDIVEGELAHVEEELQVLLMKLGTMPWVASRNGERVELVRLAVTYTQNVDSVVVGLDHLETETLLSLLTGDSSVRESFEIEVLEIRHALSRWETTLRRQQALGVPGEDLDLARLQTFEGSVDRLLMKLRSVFRFGSEADGPVVYDLIRDHVDPTIEEELLPALADALQDGRGEIAAARADLLHGTLVAVVEFLIVLFTLSLLVLLVVFGIARTMFTTLRKLREGVEQISVGNLSHRIGLSSDDELGRLAAAFDGMTEQLEKMTVSRNYYNSILHSMMDCMIVVNPDGVIRSVNPAAKRLLKYRRNELPGLPIEKVMPKTLQEEGERWKKATRHDERIWARKDGRGIPVLFSSAEMWNLDGSRNGYVLVGQDISELKEAERALRKVSEEWERTFNAVEVYVSIIDRDHRIRKVNRAMAEKMGVAPLEAEGLICYETLHGSDCPIAFCPHEQMMRDGQSHMEEIYDEKMGGFFLVSVFPIYDDDGQLDGCVHIARDITSEKSAEEEQEKLRAQLLQAQKMESIGQLAGGVAHDFNNLLSAILGYCELALMKLPEDHPVREELGIINDAGERAAALTRQLLAFSRKQVLQVRRVDLNDLVRNLTKLVRRMIGEDVTLELELSDSPPHIQADPGQIEQILMNLAVNARDAMPGGGLLTVKTSEIDMPLSETRRFEGMTPGPYVLLEVSDSGAGMTAEVQEKIFEPFFTTKGLGKGTGLGMATVYGIVKQHGGYIRLESAPEEGTSFFVYLPLAGRKVEEREKEEAGALPKGTETILVVDDETAIVGMAAKTLSILGYQVLTAASGEEALDLCGSGEQPIDLVVTDVVMPGMNGQQLAEKITGKCPKTRFLFMSGYSEEIISHHGVLDNNIQLLSKPVTPRVLAQKVRELLDADAVHNVP